MVTAWKREKHTNSRHLSCWWNSFVHSLNSTDGGRKREDRIASMDEIFARSFFVFLDESTDDAASLFRFSPVRTRQNERGERKIGRRANEKETIHCSFIVSCSLVHVHHLPRHVFVLDFWFKVERKFARVEWYRWSKSEDFRSGENRFSRFNNWFQWELQPRHDVRWWLWPRRKYSCHETNDNNAEKILQEMDKRRSKHRYLLNLRSSRISSLGWTSERVYSLSWWNQGLVADIAVREQRPHRCSMSTSLGAIFGSFDHQRTMDRRGRSESDRTCSRLWCTAMESDCQRTERSRGETMPGKVWSIQCRPTFVLTMKLIF